MLRRLEALCSLRNPNMPTQKEIEEHEISHCPYRAWCRFCVMGRGKADPHRRHEEGDPAVGTISCDYCFMGSQMDAEESSKDTIVTYVSRDHVDRWITSHLVKRKR